MAGMEIILHPSIGNNQLPPFLVAVKPGDDGAATLVLNQCTSQKSMAGCREGAVTPFRPLLRCAVTLPGHVRGDLKAVASARTASRDVLLAESLDG
jgi:hypothetical protein